MKWLPNLLTAVRLGLVPVLILALTRIPTAEPGPTLLSAERGWALLVLLAMGATDLADGWAARRFDAATRFGSVADVVADRLTILAPLIYVAAWQPTGFPAVPVWIPVWLVALDLSVGLGWLAARLRRGIVVPLEHSAPGRVTAVILFVLVVWVVAGLPSPGALVLALAGLGMGTASAGLYHWRWWTG